MAYLKGKDFTVTFNSGVLAVKASVDISLDVDVIDVTNCDSNGFKEIIAGAKSASVSVDGLVTDANAASVVALVGSEAMLEAKIANEATISFSALCTNINVTAESEGRAEFSAEFQSNGAITIS